MFNRIVTSEELCLVALHFKYPASYNSHANMHAHAMVVVSGARTLIVSGAQMWASPMMTLVSC